MKNWIEISKESVLHKGQYRLQFEALILTEQVEWILDKLSGMIEKTYEIVEGKPIVIQDVYSENNIIFIEFELLENPIPVLLIVGGVLGLLGLFGSLLIFNKIEEIAKTPLGTGVGISMSVVSIGLVVVGVYYFFKVYK